MILRSGRRLVYAARMLRFARRLLMLPLGVLLLGSCGGSSANPGDGGGTQLPACTTTSDSAPAMSPATFCKIFTAICGDSHAGYANMSECLASYSALTTTKPNRQQCQSNHLCQAVPLAGDYRENHCGHATGFLGNQACEQID